MLENFQLAAIVKQGAQRLLLQVPLHQVLQDTLAEAWEEQYADFVDELQEIDFDIGYRPDGQECFVLPDYELPPWLADEDSETVPDLDAVNDHEQEFGSIAGIVAFAQDARAAELVLFQNFTRSRVIRPGQFLFLRQDTYESAERPGLTLDHGLTAVYHPTDSKLLFRNFRTTNTFLPLSEFYKEASEEEIREVLAHDRILPENTDAIALDSNEWFRKRFAMLRDSRLLDNFTAEEIRARSNGYPVVVQIEGDRVVFPAERAEARRLLQFLNEELFRGPLTREVYETNSKKRAND